MKKAIALFAVAGLASVAAAQAPTFTTRFVSYRNVTTNTADSTVLPTAGNPSSVVIGAVSAGNAAERLLRIEYNVSNFGGGAGGLVFISGNIALNSTVATDRLVINTGASGTSAPGVAPFSFPDALARGTLSANGQTITGAEPGRALTTISTTFPASEPYGTRDPEDRPLNTPPVLANGTFQGIYQFGLDLAEVSTVRNITITFTGIAQFATTWGPTGDPTIGDGTNVTQQFAPVNTVQVPFTVTGVVSVVPAPGAAALLGLGGLLAGRRRR